MLNTDKPSKLFAVGGICYGLIEIIWRGKTHWSMLIVGGLCFVSLIKVFCKIKSCSMAVKCAVGSLVVTSIEFFSGCIINKLLRQNVWDYSRNRFNIKGQVCAFYSLLWGVLSAFVVKICEKISAPKGAC